MRYDGAKFYSKDDLSYAFNLEKAEGVIKAFSDEKDFGINEILELYNIERLFEHGVVLTSWTDEMYYEYKEVVSCFRERIALFFSRIDSETALGIWENVDVQYRDDFWNLISYFFLGC